MVICTPWRLMLVKGAPEWKPRTEVIQNAAERRKGPSLFIRLTNQRLKKCFFILDLRQGTILIALLELIVLLFCGIMVGMVLLHVLEIEALIIAEVEDSPARESIALSGLSGQEAIIAEVNNESRLQVGLNLAAYKVLGISCVLMSILVHIVSSALLLLGAILRRRGMLIMWFCTTTTDLSVVFCGIIVAAVESAIRGERKFGPGIDVFIFVGLLSSSWLLHNLLIVISLFSELQQSSLHTRKANVIRNLHINIRPDWNIDADVEMLAGGDMIDEGDMTADATAAAKAAVRVAEPVAVPVKPLIPELLSDPSSELAQTLRELK